MFAFVVTPPAEPLFPQLPLPLSPLIGACSLFCIFSVSRLISDSARLDFSITYRQYISQFIHPLIILGCLFINMQYTTVPRINEAYYSILIESFPTSFQLACGASEESSE